MRRPFLFLVLFAGPLAATAVAQKTWIVDANGGGQFLAIQPAIDAAQPGDVVLVRAGTYDSFIVGKGIAVVGGPGVALTPSSRTSGSVSVHAVPAGQRAAIREIGMSGATVSVDGCGGHVHLEGISISFGFSSLAIRNSAAVSLRNISLGTTARFDGSTVAVSHCALMSLTIGSSSVTFADSTCGAAIGAPITMESGQLTVAGDRATIIHAQGPWPAHAISANNGTVVVDPQVQLIPTTGRTAIGGNANVVTRTVPSLRVSLSQVSLATTLRAPGALHGLTMVGIPLDRPVTYPFGDLWLGAHLLIDAGAFPPSGTRSTTLNFAPIPPGFTAVVQGLVAEPGGVRLSTPVVVTTG